MFIDNKNLLSHLKRSFGETVPIELLGFLGPINTVYNENEWLYHDIYKSFVKDKKGARGKERNTVFQNLFDIYASYDCAAKKTIFANDAFNKLFEELDRNARLTDIICTDDRDEIFSVMRQLIKGQSATCNFRILSNNGELHWLESHLIPTLKNNTLAQVEFIARDLTPFIEHENELNSTIEELRKLNSNLENFVSIISHDLRAPLLSIQGILEIMELSGAEAFTEEITYLKKSVTNLDKYIIDLLDYSRCAKSEMKPELLHLDTLVDEVTGNLKFMNANNGFIKLSKYVKNGVPFVSDRRVINIILNNLISNAIRYSNPNSPSPFINVKIDTTEEVAKIEVTDNGIGISKENQEKIFEMFYRVSSDDKGTGIGLHLVKKATEKLSGRISVESEPNRGTKFTVFVPNMHTNKPIFKDDNT